MFKISALIPCLLIAVVLGGRVGPAAAGAFEDEARRFVGSAFSPVSELGKGAMKSGSAVRFTRFIERRFATKALAGFVLGPYWRRASKAERAEFHSLFRIHLARSIGRQAARIARQPVAIDDVVRAAGSDEVLVFSRLGQRGPGEVYIDWRIRRTSDGPRLIDVIFQGTSLAVTHRQRFMGLMRRNGGSIAALNARMKTRLKIDPAGGASIARNTADAR